MSPLRPSWGQRWAGAHVSVPGSAIFGKPDCAATIAELRKEAVG